MSPAEEARELLGRLGVETSGTLESRSPIDGQPIGGYTELWRLERDGRLDELLAAA